MTQFRDISVNDTFDFDGGAYPTFYDRCIKTSTRKYQSLDNPKDVPSGMEVGTINAEIYHVKRTAS